MKITSQSFRDADRSHETGEARLFFLTIDGQMVHLVDIDKAVVVTGLPADKGADPQTFTPASIAFQGSEETSDINDGKATISGYVVAGALEYVVTCPTGEIKAEVYRLNDLSDLTFDWSDGMLDLEFFGVGSSLTFDDSRLTLNCVSFFFQENRTLPMPNIASQCQWALYGPGCWLNRELFKITGHITAVSRLNRRIDISETAASNLYQNGFFITAADQKVGVISVEALSPSGTRLNINYWPRNILVGQAITLYRGCDHTKSGGCTRFGNVPNFGGIPLTPIVNPSIDGINAG